MYSDDKEAGTVKAYFIRQGSATKKATLQEEQVLLSLAAKIPFDDRI